MQSTHVWRHGRLTLAVLGVALVFILLAGPVLAAHPAAQLTSPTQADGTWYTVRRGDTLYRIALRYGVTVAAIVRANSLRNPNFIYVGQRLWIPTGGSTPPPAPTPEPGNTPVPQPTSAPNPEPSDGVWYTVRRGDTLGRIAQRYGVTVSAIVRANNLRNANFIRVGQRLWIPTGGGGGSPEPQPTQPPSSNPIPGVSFGYGFQIQCWGGADLSQAINATRDAGFNWLKIQLPWKEIERDGKGQYSWGELDRIIDQISGAGLNLLVSIVKAPNWARPAGTDPGKEGPPSNPQDLADFCAAVAGRYKGRVKAIEVWNEQNLNSEWGGEPIDASRYVDMLCRSYNAIKGQDAAIVVISGGLTPTGVNDGRIAIDDYVYLQQMYQRGAKNCMDGVGVHPSGYNNPPDARYGYNDANEPSFKNHPSFFFQETMVRYRNLMVARGDGNKRLWPTEFGWASSPNPVAGYEYARDVTLDEQAQYLVRAYQLMRQWGYVGPAFAWNLNFTDPSSETSQFCIMGRPAYDALKNMAK